MLSVGIVGLPNVGKSTLFNALLKREIAKVGPNPFTTIKPNKGIVAVPDERLDRLVKMLSSFAPGAKEVPAPGAGEIQRCPAKIEFVDIAGLVKGAAKGEGLGNQFLSHIREVDLILHVIREFENAQVSHVDGNIDPMRDISTIDTELTLSDFEIVCKGIEERSRKIGRSDEQQQELKVLKRLKPVLEKGRPALTAGLDKEEQKIIGSFNLLTLKPVIYVLNISEKHLDDKDYPKKDLPEGVIVPVCIKLASDLYQLSAKERKEYLKEYNIQKTGLAKIIKTAFKTLSLITFTLPSRQFHDILKP